MMRVSASQLRVNLSLSLLLMYSLSGAMPANHGLTHAGQALAAPVTAEPGADAGNPATPPTETPGVNEVPDAPERDTPKAEEEDGPACPALYQRLLARYGQDYSPCVASTSAPSTCPKPQAVTGDFKEQLNIQLLLDSSGSMAGKVGGRAKIDIAKEVLSNFVDTLPRQAKVSLRVYGHAGSSSRQDKTLSCSRSDLIYPFQALDTIRFKTAIKSFGPMGWTPIAHSLQQAQADFAGFDGTHNSNLIYLVSDGKETCDGDPVAAARGLRESHIQAIVNIIGFDVDADTARQLRATAQAGGGQYYEARNAAELQRVFRQSINLRAWNEYYSCVLGEQNRQLSQTLREQNTALSCALQKANQELSAILRDANSNYQQYGSECYKLITDQASARYRRLVDSASKDYRSTIDAASQEYHEALDKAGNEYRGGIQRPARP